MTFSSNGIGREGWSAEASRGSDAMNVRRAKSSVSSGNLKGSCSEFLSLHMVIAYWVRVSVVRLAETSRDLKPEHARMLRDACEAFFALSKLIQLCYCAGRGVSAALMRASGRALSRSTKCTMRTTSFPKPEPQCTRLLTD